MIGDNEKLGQVLIPTLRNIGAKREVLPYGRYQTTFDEIETFYSVNNDPSRNAIWTEFMQHFAVVRKGFGEVAAIWVSGSFITSEQTPHDIDVVYLVTESMYANATQSNLGKFAIQRLTNKRKSFNQKSMVDSYLLVVPPTEYGYEQDKYLAIRGYWDQFWSKTRFDADSSRWLYPAAGYLEVIIDGYGK